jgi:hypothetical protein
VGKVAAAQLLAIGSASPHGIYVIQILITQVHAPLYNGVRDSQNFGVHSGYSLRLKQHSVCNKNTHLAIKNT